MKYDSICLMLPTYGRSETLLPRFITSATATAKNLADLKFAFCINEKDTKTYDYLMRLPWPNRKNLLIVFEKTEKPNLAYYFNLLYTGAQIFGDGCVASMVGDDMEIITPGWDEKILNAINQYDGIGVFWCNDDYIAKERMCVNMFVARKFVDATERPFMAEEFEADMIDYVWRKIAKYTRTAHYFPDIIIKHNHNTSKPRGQWDSTFNRLRPSQAQGHVVGKGRAKEIAHKVADTLIAKGMYGSSI